MTCTEDIGASATRSVTRIRQVVSLAVALVINWRLHFGALGSTEQLKESLRQISPISPSGRWRRGKAIHSLPMGAKGARAASGRSGPRLVGTGRPSVRRQRQERSAGSGKRRSAWGFAVVGAGVGS